MRLAVLTAAVLASFVVAACEAGPAPATPPVVAGSSAQPREVNVIAKDYSFLPASVDLVPGETVVLHVVNGGLEVHEAIFGDASVQDAWEVAEAATAGAPPGPTPLVSVPPDVSGIRIVVESGQRVDVVWTVPADAAAGPAWVVGCHIPGHWDKGMQVPVRWIDPSRAMIHARPVRVAVHESRSVVRSQPRAGWGAPERRERPSKEVPGWPM